MVFDPYRILNVDKNASIEEINTAYFRLAKQYHPDRNKGIDATNKMKELNEAYEILKNPKKRSDFDRTFNRQNQEPYAKARYYSMNDYLKNFKCQRCGVTDHTLRIVHFPYAVSLIFVTLKRGWGGIFCSECRKEEMAKAKFISLFFGWWGLPWGIVYTLKSLFSFWGEIPNQVNAEYVKALGRVLYNLGDYFDARIAFKESLEISDDPDLRNVIKEMDNYPYKRIIKTRPSKPTLLIFRICVSLISFLLFRDLFLNNKEIEPLNNNVATQSFSPETSEFIFRVTPTIDYEEIWKIYKNEELGYFAYYPTSYTYEEEDQDVYFYNLSSYESVDDIGFAIFYSDIGLNISDGEIDSEFIKSYQEEVFENQGFIVDQSLKKHYITNKPALSGSFHKLLEDGFYKTYITTVFNDNRVYQLMAVGSQSNDDYLYNQYEKFVSYFRLVY